MDNALNFVLVFGAIAIAGGIGFYAKMFYDRYRDKKTKGLAHIRSPEIRQQIEDVRSATADLKSKRCEMSAPNGVSR